MHIFFQHDIETSLQLSEEESKHALRVLRLREGDEIEIYDGTGNIYTALIKNLKLKKLEIDIIKKTRPPNARSFHLHVAIAPTKNMSRFEWFLEKATEIGIDEITPLLCDRSERNSINLERLNKILISSCKQSQNPYLPTLHYLTKFLDFINQNSAEPKYIAHCYSKNLDPLKARYRKSLNCCILIGPEGDFTEAEIDYAIKNNFIEINLGPSRLRTETAGIVACHTINFMNQ